MTICSVQVAVYDLEYRFETPLVGIGQRAFPDFEGYAKMCQLAGFGKQ